MLTIMINPVIYDFGVRTSATMNRSKDTTCTRGLSRMGRNHIHMANGGPGGAGVISGMRLGPPIVITVDVRAAMQDGVQFFRSDNNVILSPGPILPRHFAKVKRVERWDRGRDCDRDPRKAKVPKLAN